MLKCRDCPVICHIECKTTVAQLCVCGQTKVLCGVSIYISYVLSIYISVILGHVAKQA